MREERLQDQVPEGLTAPTGSESEPDQGEDPKVGVSVPAESAGSWPDEGDIPKTGVAVPVTSEAE